MTSAEFRAWFAGFTDKMPPGETPSYPHWVKIKERVEQINEVPTPYPVFISGFWPFPKRDHWWEWAIGAGAPKLLGLSLKEQHAYNLSIESAGKFYDNEEYGRYAGFYALGRAERESAR